MKNEKLNRPMDEDTEQSTRCRAKSRDKTSVRAGLGIALLMASSTFVFSSCLGKDKDALPAGANVDPNSIPSTDQIQQAPEKEKTSLDRDYEEDNTENGVATAAVGQLSEMPAALKNQQKATLEMMQNYQRLLITDFGLKDTGVRSVFGHRIYTQGGSTVFIFSGMDLLVSDVAVDVGDPASPLFNKKEFDGVFGKSEYAIKLEDGRVRQMEGEWRDEMYSSPRFIYQVMVNNQVTSSVLDTNLYEEGGKLKLSALVDNFSTLAKAREWVTQHTLNKMKIGDEEFYMISVTEDFVVGFDGDSSFVMFAKKMAMPYEIGTNPNGVSIMRVDIPAYLDSLYDVAKENGVQVKKELRMFTARAATVVEDEYRRENVLDLETGKIDNVDTLYVDHNGSLYISLDALKKTSGVEIKFSADGRKMNIITDSWYNGDSPEGSLTGVPEAVVLTTVEAKESQKWVEQLKSGKVDSDKVEQVSNSTRGSGSTSSADADGGATTSEGNGGSSGSSGSGGGSGSSGQRPTDPEDQDGNGLPDWMDEELRRQQEAMSGSGPVKPDSYYVGKPEPSGTPGNALPSVREGKAVWRSDLGGWYEDTGVGSPHIIYPSGGGANIR